MHFDTIDKLKEITFSRNWEPHSPSPLIKHLHTMSDPKFPDQDWKVASAKYQKVHTFTTLLVHWHFDSSAISFRIYEKFSLSLIIINFFLVHELLNHQLIGYKINVKGIPFYKFCLFRNDKSIYTYANIINIFLVFYSSKDTS